MRQGAIALVLGVLCGAFIGNELGRTRTLDSSRCDSMRVTVRPPARAPRLSKLLLKHGPQTPIKPNADGTFTLPFMFCAGNLYHLVVDEGWKVEGMTRASQQRSSRE